MSTGKVFDLKVGYSCNNNCIHCVIKTNVENMIDSGFKSIDTNYAELIKIMNSDSFKKANAVVITGGEPTIRKEFLRIIKYIVTKYPNKEIYIQTNGRLLGRYLDEFKSLSNKINYVIAIHSINEEVHNRIVNNRSEKGNPYKETMETLEKIKKVYGKFEDIARIEIVLSSLNYKTIPETIIKLHQMELKNIGISYPHLDGFYDKYGKNKVKEVGLSYADLKMILPDIYEYAYNNKDLRLIFEEVPMCMWRSKEGYLLKNINNIRSMSNRTGNEDISVKFPERNIDENFVYTWFNLHKKSNECIKCQFYRQCNGVWYEAIDTYGDIGFTPISKEERDRICTQ